MILIVGCGYLGETLADDLHGRGHQVLGVTHSAESAGRLSETKPWRAIACDISDGAAVSKLGNEPVKTVIHCASSSRGGPDAYRRVFLEGLNHLRETFPSAHLLFTSSTSVYTQVDGSLVDEDTPCQPQRETGRILQEAEQFVLAQNGTVARLAGIYGPERSVVLKNLLLKEAKIEGNDGQGRLLNQIHRDDAVSAIRLLVEDRVSGVFNVVDSTAQTQRELYTLLAAKFNAPMPPVAEPNHERKRPYTHKAVSNNKLRALGWRPEYPGYMDAIDRDPLLASSILQQCLDASGSIPRAPNIVVIGLMGCGKSTVGRLVAQKIGFQVVDTDHLVSDTAHQSIPAIFQREGEVGFRKRETAALLSLLGKRGHVIATGGGIVTQPHNLPLLKHLGYVVWLNAEPSTLAKRTSSSNDRPLLQNEDPEAKLRALLDVRGPLYRKLADLRIRTDDLSPQETAYGIAESARLHFCT
ncbi:MAG: NAD-dependent epimerase/dehydratase family protein [Verrucomicrobiaceae bacterium]|nr:NAD-dependent epimerase/dehydratase family protein [Verrucomicrobiaceae bacterium]